MAINKNHQALGDEEQDFVRLGGTGSISMDRMQQGAGQARQGLGPAQGNYGMLGDVGANR